jgi:hypothetical protein
MKTILFSAAALSFTGAALANGGEWSALDREVETLASSLVDNHEGIAFSGYADIWYLNSGDDDVSGFLINNARIMAEGGSDGFGAYIEYAFDLNALLEGYVTQELGGMKLTAGRTRFVTTATSAEHERDMTFMNRSWIGNTYTGRSEGVQLSGGEGGMNWNVGISNGSDDIVDDYQISAHVDAEIGGGMAVGATYTQDDFTDSDAFIIDFSWSGEGMGVAAEIASLSENGSAVPFDALGLGGFDGSIGVAVLNTGFAQTLAAAADITPFAVCAHFDVGGGNTLAARYQDADIDNADVIDIAYGMGNYTIQYSMYGEAAGDSDVILAGLQVGF